MTTKLFIPIVMQLMGVLVIIAEIFLPSGGLLSLMAIIIFGYSLYYAFIELTSIIGVVLVAIDIVLIPVLVIYGLKLVAKSPVTLRKALSSKDGVTSQSATLITFQGKNGIAVSDLRPAGMAKIDGQRVDVVTRGEYIEKGTGIQVTAVKGNQIIVKVQE